jgi:hypothetical protein
VGLAVALQKVLDRWGQAVEHVAGHSDRSRWLVASALGLSLEHLPRFGVQATQLHRSEQGDRRLKVLIGHLEDQRVDLPMSGPLNSL